MIFTFSLILILITEFIFVNSLTVNQVFLVQLIGYTHLLIFLVALIALFLIFRNRKKKTNFKIGFTIFGTFVVCFVPSLAYMIPGTAYLLTDHSPVSWKYKKWAGLYKVGKQYLYDNRGFGYIGFPGRVGIYPEITEIILKKVNYSGGNKRSS